MVDGTEIPAPVVVSDAGVHTTVRRLLPPDVARQHGLPAAADEIPASAGHLCVYVGLRRTADELRLPKTNLWIYPGDDHDANLAAFRADPDGAKLPLVYVSFPSAKDPAFAGRFPGRATIELITFAPWDTFVKWADGRWRRRGPDYEALKQRFAARMLDLLHAQLPQVRDVVTCGVGGALAAGYVTASAILGRNLLAAATRG